MCSDTDTCLRLLSDDHNTGDCLTWLEQRRTVFCCMIHASIRVVVYTSSVKTIAVVLSCAVALLFYWPVQLSIQALCKHLNILIHTGNACVLLYMK